MASKALTTAFPGAETLLFNSGKLTLVDSISPFSSLIISSNAGGVSIA
jgi:hypothetical protein